MKLQRLYTLLIVWGIFLMLPGLLMELGLRGRIDANSSSGGLILLWVVGYLAQFAIFLWMMNIVGEQKVLWWFAASLLPWGIDWTLPVSAWFIALWLPITIGLAYWIALVARRAEFLQQQGIHATGVVLEVFKPWMNVVINNVYIRRKLRLRVEREDGTPAYEGILKGLFMLGEIPSPGDRIPLIVDPAKPQRFEYDKGTDAAPVAPARSMARSAAAQGDIADDLAKLAELHNRGTLSDSEFAAAKKKLLH